MFPPSGDCHNMQFYFTYEVRTWLNPQVKPRGFCVCLQSMETNFIFKNILAYSEQQSNKDLGTHVNANKNKVTLFCLEKKLKGNH